MSRIADNPIKIPKGVGLKLDVHDLIVNGPKGTLNYVIPSNVEIQISSESILIITDKSDKSSNALSGTTRAIINNMVQGVHSGFEKKLTLVGVGYRAQGKGNSVSLSLGFSHPLEYEAPVGISIETPTQTEILIKGINKQIVGQVAANIRAYRPPEPYKGKGIRYSDEEIIRKEAKKK
jgi:large subunit ribosomal protein L6